MMAAFLHACGVHPGLELEVEATSKVRAVRYSLRQPFAIVGRHPAADVYLDSDGIRPRHIYFQAIEGRIACVNVSQTGTIQTSEAEVETFCWLKPGDSVHFGHRSLRLIQDEETVTVPGSAILDPLAIGSAWEIFGPRITLEITNELVSRTPKLWLVDRLLTLVGRTSRCALQLMDDAISNVHCSLVLTTTGLWVVDLLGRGGIVINEQPVRFGQLGLEDELRLGPYRIRLQEIPVAFRIPDEEKAFRPLTPASDFQIQPAVEPGSHHQIRMYHTPWPNDAEHADVLEELIDKLQDMKGPMFTQHQNIITRMIETYETLGAEQREVVKRELDRLNSLQDEMEIIQQLEDAVHSAGSNVVPTESQQEASQQLVTSDDIHLDKLENSGSFRSATSLLQESDTSVFRMPKKVGDLFESLPNPVETDNPAEDQSESWAEWNDPDTELLNKDPVETEPYQDEQIDDVHNRYEPDTNEQRHPNIEELLTFEAPHAAAHRLHDRIDHLREEQSSIWQRLSKFFFGKTH